MITAISTCVGYDDYLSISLPLNRSFFKNYYIVTTKEDKATQKLAKAYDCKLVLTDIFTKKASFNKGAAINLALASLKDTWVCHIDSDIVIEADTIPLINKNNIYGCIRYMCPSVAAWKQKKHSEWETYNGKFFVVNGVKIKKWLPLGYFQLWHTSSNNLYPSNCTTAAESDVIFSLNWDNQICLENIKALHLPVVGNPIEGANWRGRTTKRLVI